METKGLMIETPGFTHRDQRNIGNLGSYAEIMVPSGTTSFPIVVTPLDSHRRFASFGLQGRSSQEQNSVTIEVNGKGFRGFPPVPIEWSGKIPKTRLEPRDNFRIILVKKNGAVDQVEIGCATRGQRVFLTSQLQFRGIILPSKNGDTPMIAPTLEHFSYPGFAGYNEQWPGILPHLQRWTTEWEVKPEGRSPKVKWDPGHNPFGEEGAAVLYFSPVGGTGQLLTAKGVEQCLASGQIPQGQVLFLHLTGLDPQVNEQIGVEPMTWVRVGEIKPPRVGAQHRQATHVTLR